MEMGVGKGEGQLKRGWLSIPGCHCPWALKQRDSGQNAMAVAALVASQGHHGPTEQGEKADWG